MVNAQVFQRKRRRCAWASQKKKKKISEGNLAQVKRLETRFDAGEEKKDGEE